MFINVCMHLNFHSTSIHHLIRRIIKTQIQNKTMLDPIHRIANLSLASSVKSKCCMGPPQTPSWLHYRQVRGQVSDGAGTLNHSITNTLQE